MRLLKRVNTVITAQLHDVVECFENPEKILKQTIREMETTLEKATESTARAIAGEKQLERRLAEARTSADRWHVRAREAIKVGDESTARTALARRCEVETGASALAAQLAHCKESNARLRHQLEQLRGRLAAAKGEMGVLIARQRSAEAQRQFAKTETFGSFDVESLHYFDELSHARRRNRGRSRGGSASCASTRRRKICLERRTSNANCNGSKSNVRLRASERNFAADRGGP